MGQKSTKVYILNIDLFPTFFLASFSIFSLFLYRCDVNILIFLLCVFRMFFLLLLCLLSCFCDVLVLMLVLSWCVCVLEKSWTSFLVFLSSKDLHYNHVMFLKYPCLFCLCSYFHDFFVIYFNIIAYFCCFSFIVQVWSYFHNFLCAPKRCRQFFFIKLPKIFVIIVSCLFNFVLTLLLFSCVGIGNLLVSLHYFVIDFLLVGYHLILY